MMLCVPQTLSALRDCLARYGMRLELLADGAPIVGSHWGEPEAGLVDHTLYVRSDTPLHSALHEAAHYICMDELRRTSLHTNAGGDYEEENGVCFLQIVLARELGVSVVDACADMDTWGYSFRLGSAYAWFTQDAQDARAWLVRHGLLAGNGTPTWRCRIDTPIATTSGG